MFDPLLLSWIVIWTSITSYGVYLILSDNKQASVFYVYGKSLEANKKKGLFWSLFLVPKRWFAHFYLVAISVFVSSLAAVIAYYQSNIQLTNTSIPGVHIETFKDIHRTSSLVFTLILMIVQCSRRLYECLSISVHSSTSRINIIHYAFGHLFYILAAVSTIAPILLSDTSNQYTLNDILANLVNRRRAICFVLFVYVSHHQHKCHIILANLRKNKAGQVITEQHFVPSGGLFEFVSCPHFLLEILLYLIIILVQEFASNYWNLIFLLVFSTQTINAITEHKWYKRKYKDYPKSRKAIFPKLL
uniref:Polyprenal reductase n=1 Tax=Aceria tosichella TaxID=561515 RepID=A0A6G1SN09_9ACAR